MKLKENDIVSFNTVHDDIALIRTESAIELPPVRLAANYSHPHLNWLRVAGYGFLSYYFDEKGIIHMQTPTNDLWQTYLYGDSKERCSFLNDPQYNNTGFNGICLWRNDSTWLFGDSGGPVFAKGTDGELYQVGIVSFFQIFSNGTFLDIATDVSFYCPWIEKTSKGEVRCQTFEPVNMEPEFAEG
uniref:Peptidase S1 domain-containing protein n=1 Tax=Panagrolaimus sp. JU765 TaxID=591449 RepID=A0AC34RIR7_9BILA